MHALLCMLVGQAPRLELLLLQEASWAQHNRLQLVPRHDWAGPCPSHGDFAPGVPGSCVERLQALSLHAGTSDLCQDEYRAVDAAEGDPECNRV